MCRKSYLHGCCIMVFALGLLVGHCLENWFVCVCVSFGLLVLGFGMLRKK